MDCIAWLQQILNRIGKNDDAASMSDTLFAGQQSIYDAVSGISGSPIIIAGKCDSGMSGSTTVIVSADLAGYGDDYFNDGWRLQVVKNANSIGNAPTGETRDITDYVSATGTFTCDAFSANVEENDSILVVYNKVSGITFSSCTSSGAIVEDGAAGAPTVVPVDSSSSANTFGSWTQIDASVSSDSYIASILCTLVSNTAIADLSYVIELGKGAAASEVPIARFSFYRDYSSEAGAELPISFILPIPIKVASGTRLSIRVACSEAGTYSLKISVQYYQSLET